MNGHYWYSLKKTLTYNGILVSEMILIALLNNRDKKNNKLLASLQAI